MNFYVVNYDRMRIWHYHDYTFYLGYAFYFIIIIK